MSLLAESLLDRIGAAMLRIAPRAGLSVPAVDAWLSDRRPLLLAAVDRALQARQARGLPLPGIVEAPPDEWTAGRRTSANLSAMQMLADLERSRRDPAPSDLRTLAGYSGWGGLSIERSMPSFPAGIPHPDPAGLIHEYYTPSTVAQAVASVVLERLETLPQGPDGTVLALEPSAGIGRFLRYLTDPKLAWLAAELSPLSALFLRYLFPRVELKMGSFESWAAANAANVAGRIGLIVANPPYGARGAERVEDPDRTYSGHRKAIYHYFLRRASDLAARGGLGVWLIPMGFLHSRGGPVAELRRTLLLRQHIAAAFRLPSTLFPGANIVTDLVLMRARGGELPGILDADGYIADGRYFEAHPTHVLGTVVGEAADEDAGRVGRRFMRIEGEFKGLPAFAERPLDDRVALRPFHDKLLPAKKRTRGGIVQAQIAIEDAPERIQVAVALARRVERYLGDVSTGQIASARLARPELLLSLAAWSAEFGAPVEDKELRVAERDYPVLARLVGAIQRDGRPTAAIAEEPKPPRLRWEGKPDDVVGQATLWWADRRDLVLADFAAWHASLDRSPRLPVSDLRLKLLAAGWAIPFHLNGWEDRLEPLGEYLYGNLWPKVDACGSVMGTWATLAGRQKAALLGVIKPVEFSDIADLDPRMGWIPLDLVSQWIGSAKDGSLRFQLDLKRVDGLIQIDGIPYAHLSVTKANGSDWHRWVRERGSFGAGDLTRWMVECVGWLNHDYSLWRPYVSKSQDENLEVAREAWAKDALTRFTGWISETVERQEAVREAYNRHNRGFRPREYEATPFPLARWNMGPRTTPHPWQWQGARRMVEHRGGLVAFDVGVGKTLTALLVLAAARQAGWGDRPVILVPRSLLWKWRKDVANALPDYRVIVIGSSQYVGRGGVSKTKTDSPAVMADKWAGFQAGRFDVAIVSYQAFNRIQVKAASLRKYVNRTQAIQREVKLAQERIKASQQGKKPKELTERARAILSHGTAGWLAEKLEPPKSQPYVPGITWEDIGCNLLIVDEVQNYKNLYMPSPRGSAGVPKFMGSSGEGSDMAWGLDFRSFLVRERTGGAGVVLLSATPAKNSPLEFYNVLQYVDGDAWSRIGIADPDTFVDRFVKVELQYVIEPTGDVKQRPAAVAFQNLDEIRGVLDRYAQFETAESVSKRWPERALRLPEPESRPVMVPMGPRQTEVYEALRAEARRIKESMRGGDANAALAGKLLGVMARMGLVSLHPALADSGWTYKNALDLPRAQMASAKLIALADEIRKNTACGHIIFCEQTAVHVWIREVLEARGVVPAGRVAIMNAIAVPDSGARVQMAEEFNGDEFEPPRFDVIICNSVAYEGIDLQRRTCAIYHADLPWEPATIQQRNGRGVRQGNTLDTIGILYLLAIGSFDGVRFQMIQKKRSWLTSLVESQDRVTNNPGAQQEMSGSEIAAMLASDPTQAQKLLDEAKAQIEVERRRSSRQLQEDALRSANARFRRAERSSTEPDEARRLRAEGESFLKRLGEADPGMWPWASVAERVRQQTPFLTRAKVPFPPPPLFTGMRVRITGGTGPTWIEVGRVEPTGMMVYLRLAGSNRTEGADLDGKDGSWPPPSQIMRGDVDPADYPTDDLSKTIEATRAALGRTWEADPSQLALWAPDTSLRVWEAVGAGWWAEAVKGYAKVRGMRDVRVPFATPDGLDLQNLAQPTRRTGAPMAPSDATWPQFLDLMRAALRKDRGPISWTMGNNAAQMWWRRNLPTGLAPNQGGNDG